MTKPTKWLCAQQRLRSAWASAESEQSSLCALRIAKDPKDSQGPKVSSCGQRRLIRLGKCPGWSESLLGAHAILLVLSWGGSVITIVSLVDTVHQLLKHVYEHWLLPCQTQHHLVDLFSCMDSALANIFWEFRILVCTLRPVEERKRQTFVNFKLIVIYRKQQRNFKVWDFNCSCLELKTRKHLYSHYRKIWGNLFSTSYYISSLWPS